MNQNYKNLRKAVAFILVLGLIMSIPFMPTTLVDGKAYAASTKAIVDVSTATNDVRIRLEGDNLKVNTNGAFNTVGTVSDTEVVLQGTTVVRGVIIDKNSASNETIKVVLDNLNITSTNAFTITSDAAVELNTLAGSNNSIESTAKYGAAIALNGRNTDLTITGSGILSAVFYESELNSNLYIGSGIGAGYNQDCGDITIGGAVKLSASVKRGAAIGGGVASGKAINTGSVKIVGNAIVSASSFVYGSSIGGGYAYGGGTINSGSVYISDSASVMAAFDHGAGIGGGYAEGGTINSGNIKISSKASIEINPKSAGQRAGLGAGIGGGEVNSSGRINSGTIDISGKPNITTNANSHMTGIGGGCSYDTTGTISSGSINISGNAKINLSGSSESFVGIGGGIYGKIMSGDINISDSVEIYTNTSNRGVGIGAGYAKGALTSGAIKISDNVSITAIVKEGAGIGGGYLYVGNMTTGDINISDSVNLNIGVTDGVGIGGGNAQSGTTISIGSINISGGKNITTRVAKGTGIGAGYLSTSGTQIIKTGPINISGNTSISAIVTEGAVIGAGYANSGTLNCERINIFGNAKVSANVSKGAGIGGGYCGSGTINAGSINIYGNAATSTIVGEGAGIGGGYTYTYKDINCGSINLLGDSKVYAQATKGAGIGGGVIAGSNTCKISTSDINISENAAVNSLALAGSGIGTGNMEGVGSIEVGKINISGGFVTAKVSGAGVDIGVGKNSNPSGATLTQGKITISGGSIHAVNGLISPAAVNVANAKVYKVTVPAITGQPGADISVPLKPSSVYKAKTVSDTKEHGADFPDSVGAYIYLPMDNFTGIDAGTLSDGYVDVKETPSAPNDNTIIFATIDSLDLDEVSDTVIIRVIKDRIWVSTSAGVFVNTNLNNDTDQLTLNGQLSGGGVRVDNEENTQQKVNLKLSDTKISNTGDTFYVTSNTALELELSGDNYITGSVIQGAAVKMNGSDTDLVITGSGFLSAVMPASTGQGSGIGAGYINNIDAEIGDITIGGGVKVYASVYAGAGIGGGYVNTGGIFTGDISIVGNAQVRTKVEMGAGLGGGTVDDPGTITTGNIIIDGGFVTADCTSGMDIGDGFSYLNGKVHADKVTISGGSVYAVNGTINPAPVDASGGPVYKVTIPAIDSEKGKDIIVPLSGGGKYKAKMVSAAEEHGSPMPVSAGAFVYLPRADYQNISVGAFDCIAKVVSDPATFADNLVMVKQSITSIDVDPTGAAIKRNARVDFNYQVNLAVQHAWYVQDLSGLITIGAWDGSVIDLQMTKSGLYTGNVKVKGLASGATSFTLSADGVSSAAIPVTVTALKPPIQKEFTISASAGTGGSISESGDVLVALGEDKTFTFAALDGYRVKDVIVDGESQGVLESYTFTEVVEDHNIEVKFERVIPFIDIDDHWAKDAIIYCYENGYMKGVSETRFEPDDPMLRSTFVTILGRISGINDGGADTGYIDVPKNAYYASHVLWGDQNNLVYGIGGKRFAPKLELNREQGAALMVRYAEFEGMQLTSEGAAGYSDLQKAGKWAREDILKAQNGGLMQGTGKGLFEPKKTITRGEAAQLIMNYLKNVK